MDPDDMYMNGNLLQELYNLNLNQNFDIIEFSVFQQYDGYNKIFIPKNILKLIIINFQMI